MIPSKIETKIKIEIRPQPFDPWTELPLFQQQLPPGQYGATAVFIGTLRDFNQGDGVTSLLMEHYPGMTERYLHQQVMAAQTRWPLLAVLLLHRVGELSPNMPIVLVAVWSEHRQAAFEANRYLMEVLKSQAPFWKRETLVDGAVRWVEHNTNGFSPPKGI